MTKIPLLMIDDSADDAELMGLVLARGDSAFEFHASLDPDAALRRLQEPSQPFRLVLLDLKMPQRPGHDVLMDIRASGATRHLPVIIFSSSDSPTDIRQSYALGCSAYVKKPADFNGYRKLAAHLEQFWTETATLP